MATETFRTIAWSAGTGCHGGCGQKLLVEDGRLTFAGDTEICDYMDVIAPDGGSERIAAGLARRTRAVRSTPSSAAKFRTGSTW